MRLLLALFALFLTACSPAGMTLPATTSPEEISGVMVGETVLNGDYLLVSDLLIPAGSRLVIKPGSTILIRRAEFTKIDPEFFSSMTELLVRGTLLIEGTSAAPVVIVPEKAASPSDPAWAGLLLDSVQSSSIQHTLITGADTGLLLIDAHVQVTDCRLEGNRYGAVIQGGQPTIERNQIDKGEGGLFIWNGAAPSLKENIVSQNEEEGIYIDRSSHPQMVDNRSENNAIGLVSTVLPGINGLLLLGNGESWRQLQRRQETE